MEEQKPLNVSAIENVQSAVLKLILGYKNMPFELTNKNVLMENIADGTSIGIFTLSGAVYKDEYVSGNYTAIFPFRLVYKTATTKNVDAINAQQALTDLAIWLEKCSATFADDKLKFQSIKRTSQVYEMGVDAQTKQYSCTMQLEYFSKK